MYEFELYPQQMNFMKARGLSAFIAGIGSGKTFVGSLKSIMHAQPNTLGMIVAPSYKMLKDSTLRTFKEIAGDALLDINKQEMIGYVQGGAEILLRSADNPESLRGPNLHWIWIDEGSLCKDGTWEICIGRIRAGGEFGSLWVTGTPKGKNHWTYKVIDQLEITRATTLDNPYASKQWIESLLKAYKGNFLRQEVYGDFVSFEGLVYTIFDQSTHVMRRKIDRESEVFFAVDEGYTNPAVVLKIRKTSDASYHVEEEWYERGKLHSQIVEAALEMANQQGGSVIVDRSAAALRAEFRNAGFEVKSSQGRVLDGINTVLTLLTEKGIGGIPRLTVDPSCVNTINEFESYIWKDGKDEPVKEYDHAMDALRYGITSKPEPRKAQQSRW